VAADQPSYQRLPSWVLGFHGTDSETAQKILSSSTSHLRSSTNGWDWLGEGIYFWENDPERAASFARERFRWKGIRDKKVAVVGAVIDLGLCLNLFDQPALVEMKAAYDSLASDFDVMGQDLPKNKGHSADLVERYLDQAVMTHLHALRRALPEEFEPYQTVRAGFLEGAELYPNTAFRTKNHIQIAVMDKNCIKGYFAPRKRAP
jgi:hypothetical protein